MGRQEPLNLRQHASRVRALAVGFVQEEQRRNPLLLQGLEEGLRMGLHAFNGADHHHCRVQRPQGTLHLGGKIHVAGGVNEVDGRIPPVKADAGGLDGNTPALLYGQIIGVGRALVHTADATDGPGMHQQLLGKGRLARVHVGKDADVSDVHRNLHQCVGGIIAHHPVERNRRHACKKAHIRRAP